MKFTFTRKTLPLFALLTILFFGSCSRENTALQRGTRLEAQQALITEPVTTETTVTEATSEAMEATAPVAAKAQVPAKTENAVAAKAKTKKGKGLFAFHAKKEAKRAVKETLASSAPSFKAKTSIASESSAQIDGNLRLAIIFAILAVLFGILSFIPFFGIFALIALVVAVIFLLLWILNAA